MKSLLEKQIEEARHPIRNGIKLMSVLLIVLASMAAFCAGVVYILVKFIKFAWGA